MPSDDNGAGRVKPIQRRQLDAIFGEVLPESTADEREPQRSDSEGRDTDSWHLENRPPHHDR